MRLNFGFIKSFGELSLYQIQLIKGEGYFSFLCVQGEVYLKIVICFLKCMTVL